MRMFRVLFHLEKGNIVLFAFGGDGCVNHVAGLIIHAIAEVDGTQLDADCLLWNECASSVKNEGWLGG